MQSLYISGPMSGFEDHNFPAFLAAADALRRAGHTVVNPADGGAVPGRTWEGYLRRDLARMLAECGGVAVLPGWADSRGAALEVHVARALSMPVRAVGAWCE